MARPGDRCPGGAGSRPRTRPCGRNTVFRATIRRPRCPPSSRRVPRHLGTTRPPRSRRAGRRGERAIPVPRRRRRSPTAAVLTAGAWGRPAAARATGIGRPGPPLRWRRIPRRPHGRSRATPRPLLRPRGRPRSPRPRRRPPRRRAAVARAKGAGPATVLLWLERRDRRTHRTITRSPILREPTNCSIPARRGRKPPWRNSSPRSLPH